ncbi:MAG: hypothetical protein AB8G05_28480 [Oligoflexales bacterium]
MRLLLFLFMVIYSHTQAYAFHAGVSCDLSVLPFSSSQETEIYSIELKPTEEGQFFGTIQKIGNGDLVWLLLSRRPSPLSGKHNLAISREISEGDTLRNIASGSFEIDEGRYHVTGDDHERGHTLILVCGTGKEDLKDDN